MTDDRVLYDEPDSDLVDEIVVTGATVHFEMNDQSSGYLTVTRDGRQLFAQVWAEPTTRAQRRRLLAANDDRLRDHLTSLIPAWLGGRSIWSIPPWQRPASCVRTWREQRQAARAVLRVRIDDDELTDNEPKGEQ